MSKYIVNIQKESFKESHLKVMETLLEQWKEEYPYIFDPTINTQFEFVGFQLVNLEDTNTWKQTLRVGGAVTGKDIRNLQESFRDQGFKLTSPPPILVVPNPEGSFTFDPKNAGGNSRTTAMKRDGSIKTKNIPVAVFRPVKDMEEEIFDSEFEIWGLELNPPSDPSNPRSLADIGGVCRRQIKRFIDTEGKVGINPSSLKDIRNFFDMRDTKNSFTNKAKQVISTTIYNEVNPIAGCEVIPWDTPGKIGSDDYKRAEMILKNSGLGNEKNIEYMVTSAEEISKAIRRACKLSRETTKTIRIIFSLGTQTEDDPHQEYKQSMYDAVEQFRSATYDLMYAFGLEHGFKKIEIYGFLPSYEEFQDINKVILFNKSKMTAYQKGKYTYNLDSPYLSDDVNEELENAA